MDLRDWRDAPAELLAPVYEAERQRWLRTLQWDSASSWREVEQARITWGLPGLIAMDGSGAVRGLTFYLQDEDRLDIGGFVSGDEGVTDALLGGALDAAAAIGARTIRMLTLDSATALGSGLRVRGFDVEPHYYLSRTVTRPGAVPPAPASDAPGLDRWRDDDLEGAASLLHRAYDPASASLFAPHHERAEWERYLRNLLSHGGCGVVNREATRVVRNGSTIEGLALISEISPGVAHLVQMAVDPRRRGEGLGRALITAVCGHLAARSCAALTLLVAASNRPARALYDRAGFRVDARFLRATLSPPAHRILACHQRAAASSGTMPFS